jgi:hypothetical protein
MLRAIILFSVFMSSLSVSAQEYQSDWDVYLMESDMKPVAIMVDLGIAKAAPLGDRLNLIILHLKYGDTLADGMPTPTGMKMLEKAEDDLVPVMESGLSAVYVGRFTKSGKRDFYFYTNDTSTYHHILKDALQSYPSYQWYASARRDADWTDYFQVLYPSPRELERIMNRRSLDKLRAAGDPLSAARKVGHWIYFKTKEGRKNFVFSAQDEKFDILEAGEEAGVKDFTYSLHISRIDKVDYISMDKLTLHLWELALKNNGKYDGWETLVLH